MKHQVKLNILHNGKQYEKGSPISESDPAFKPFNENGWIEELEAKKVEAEVVADAEPVEQKQPEKKSKK